MFSWSSDVLVADISDCRCQKLVWGCSTVFFTIRLSHWALTWIQKGVKTIITVSLFVLFSSFCNILPCVHFQSVSWGTSSWCTIFQYSNIEVVIETFRQILSVNMNLYNATSDTALTETAVTQCTMLPLGLCDSTNTCVVVCFGCWHPGLYWV